VHTCNHCFLYLILLDHPLSVFAMLSLTLLLASWLLTYKYPYFAVAANMTANSAVTLCCTAAHATTTAFAASVLMVNCHNFYFLFAVMVVVCGQSSLCCQFWSHHCCGLLMSLLSLLADCCFSFFHVAIIKARWWCCLATAFCPWQASLDCCLVILFPVAIIAMHYHPHIFHCFLLLLLLVMPAL